MKAVLVLCFVVVAAMAQRDRVRVVESSGDLNNVDPSFGRPTTGNDGTLYNVDQGFYRPTVNNNPNGGYQPISTGPEIVQNPPGGPYQNGPPGYPYRHNTHPGARGGR